MASKCEIAMADAERESLLRRLILGNEVLGVLMILHGKAGDTGFVKSAKEAAHETGPEHPAGDTYPLLALVMRADPAQTRIWLDKALATAQTIRDDRRRHRFVSFLLLTKGMVLEEKRGA